MRQSNIAVNVIFFDVVQSTFVADDTISRCAVRSTVSRPLQSVSASVNCQVTLVCRRAIYTCTAVFDQWNSFSTPRIKPSVELCRDPLFSLLLLSYITLTPDIRPDTPRPTLPPPAHRSPWSSLLFAVALCCALLHLRLVALSPSLALLLNLLRLSPGLANTLRSHYRTQRAHITRTFRSCSPPPSLLGFAQRLQR